MDESRLMALTRLVPLLRAAVPKGLCAYCEAPLPPGCTLKCRAHECIRRLQEDRQVGRRVRARPPGPRRAPRLTGLVRLLRPEVRAGSCVYCEYPLKGRRTLYCVSPDCVRCYNRDVAQERRRLEREARHG